MYGIAKRVRSNGMLPSVSDCAPVEKMPEKNFLKSAIQPYLTNLSWSFSLRRK